MYEYVFGNDEFAQIRRKQVTLVKKYRLLRNLDFSLSGLQSMFYEYLSEFETYRRHPKKS